MSELSLEIVEGPDAGQQVKLSGPLVIGRGSDADLVLPDAQVSRHHVRVTPDVGHVTVEDLGSSNGTFLNSNELHAPARMDPGEELQVGVTVMELRTEREIAAQPSAVRTVPPGLAAPERTPDYVSPDPTPDVVVAEKPQVGPADLNALRDVSVRAAAKTAPLAIFVLAAFAVIIYLATR